MVLSVGDGICRALWRQLSLETAVTLTLIGAVFGLGDLSAAASGSQTETWKRVHGLHWFQKCSSSVLPVCAARLLLSAQGCRWSGRLMLSLGATDSSFRGHLCV